MIRTTRSTIRYKQMVLSPINVRKTPPDHPTIPGLADSIGELGLLQHPVVHKLKGGKFGALDGGRRYHAIGLLLTRGGSAFNFDEVPVIIAEGTEAELIQLSATANFQREKMADVEMYHAVKMVTDLNPDATDEMLALGFGVDVARMRRILRLAHIHPEILEAYAKNELHETSLRAYAATADQDLQKQAYDSLDGWYKNNPNAIRRALGVAEDKTLEVLSVVGVEAYVAAGGEFEADLFVQNSGRVLHPAILGQLYNDLVAGTEQTLREQYPDRQLTFGEPPRDSYSVDHRLQAHPVPAVPPAVAERMEELGETIGILEEELSEAVDWDRCDEDGIEVNVQSGETSWDTVPLLCDLARILEIEAELAPLRDEHQRLEAEAAAAPPALPLAATHVHLKSQNGSLVPTFWYPDAKAAGLSRRAGGAKAAAAAKSVDPANPTLSGRAEIWLRAARVRMAITHILGGGSASADTRARAHKALIFAMANRLVVARLGERSDYGLVYNFAGATYTFSGSGVDSPDAALLDAVSAVPGISDRDSVTGFLTFENSATREQVDLCAAAVFALKINGQLERTGSVVDEVMTDLAQPAFARRAWTPTLDFFDLFRKSAILAWTATVETGFPFFDLKVKDLKSAAVDFFTGGPGAPMRFGLSPEALEAVRGWVPTWLRWSSAEALAAKRPRSNVAAAVMASETAGATPDPGADSGGQPHTEEPCGEGADPAAEIDAGLTDDEDVAAADGALAGAC